MRISGSTAPTSWRTVRKIKSSCKGTPVRASWRYDSPVETHDTQAVAALRGLPSALSLGQGQSTEIVFDPGDPAPSFDSSDPELDVEYDAGSHILRLHAGYDSPSSARLDVSVIDASGNRLVHSIDVSVKMLGWQKPVVWDRNGPEGREHASVFVHAAARKAYVFGGSGYNPYLIPMDDAWSFDLDTGVWRAAGIRGEFLEGASRRVATKSGTTTAYVFGGYGERLRAQGELHRVDFGEGVLVFSEVPQVNPPPARCLHCFVYDAPSDRFVLFGGMARIPRSGGRGVVFGDTWTMHLEDGVAVWTQLAPEVSPSPRYGFLHGFDADRGRLLLFSGGQGIQPINPARDSWVLDVRAETPVWTRIAERAFRPHARRNGAMIFDSSGPRMFVFGGTPDGRNTEPGLFVLDGRPGHEGWTHLELAGEPPLRSSGFGFYDPLLERTHMGFGNTVIHVFQDLAALGYE